MAAQDRSVRSKACGLSGAKEILGFCNSFERCSTQRLDRFRHSRELDGEPFDRADARASSRCVRARPRSEIAASVMSPTPGEGNGGFVGTATLHQGSELGLDVADMHALGRHVTKMIESFMNRHSFEMKWQSLAHAPRRCVATAM